MPDRIRVSISPEHTTTALLYPAAARDRAGVALILAHGAGAGQASPFMVSAAEGLAARGVDAVTFNFLYAEERRRLPDRNDALEACWRAVIEAVRGDARFKGRALAIGGKSMGGRIASQVAAKGAGDIAALVFLGYPLHPPGKPQQLRAKHLPQIMAPMLFVQGARDAFGTPDELRPILAPLGARATLHVVEGGDHSFKVPKREGRAQKEVEEAMLGAVAGWLREKAAG